MSGSNALTYPNASLGALINVGTNWSGVGAVSGGTAVAPANSPVAAVGAVVVVDNSAFVSINVNTSTASWGVTKADNRTLAPPSYTFVSSSTDQYTKIFSAQCDRVNNYIFGQLERVDRSDQDQNEVVADGIAGVIDLVGEPAACTALFEAHLLTEEPTILEPLLLAIGSASHKETEAARIAGLRHFANASNYRIKRAAIRALGRMKAPAARQALREISKNSQGEIASFAAALLR
jgi:hypothetical protein